MTLLAIEMYHSFSDAACGGSPAAIVWDGAPFADGAIKRIAKELGAPARWMTGRIALPDHLMEMPYIQEA